MALCAAAQPVRGSDRACWVELMTRIAQPVLGALSEQRLTETMPFESQSADERRREVSRLEAFGRTICGIGPWLELGEDASAEGKVRGRFIRMAQRAMRHAVDPASKDRMVFDNRHSQPLVDAAFLAQGVLRAPTQLWRRLDRETRAMLVEAWKQTRSITPGETNWLLFASMVEAALLETTGECDTHRLLYGVHRFLSDGWYKGDGVYGDGAEVHVDFYNSIVIHPMLTDVLRVLERHQLPYGNYLRLQLEREKRLAAELERLISPEGTYPAVGRSITYRFGVFHALSHSALLGNLPEQVTPAQVRSALTAVMKRQAGMAGTFDADGWLTVGFAGHQLRMSETYINTGSQYMCMAVFLPLGLPETDPFWTGPYTEWSNLRAWKGEDIGADHALRDSRATP